VSKVYSFSSYDKYFALKIDFYTWLIIVYFMRPLILKFSTIQLGRGGVKSDSVSGLRDLVYPNDFGIFLAVLVVIPVAVVIFAYAKRKPEASDLVRKLWRNGRNLLVAAAALDIVIIFVPLIVLESYSVNTAGWAQLAIDGGILGYLLTSKRVADTFADFPREEATEAGSK
jgi:hypothetical protein